MSKPITTVVPVYKTAYIEDLLSCLQAQSAQEFSVLMGDDTPLGNLQDKLQDLHSKHAFSFAIKVMPGHRLGPLSNTLALLKQWNHSSPYVHILMDDDLIFPDFYAHHLQAMDAMPEASCTVSQRFVCNENRIPIGSCAAYLPFAHHLHRLLPLHEAEAYKHTLPYSQNWLGELSFALLRATHLARIDIRQLHTLPYYGLDDLGIFLNLVRTGPIAYIQQFLGAFRRNPHQTTGNIHSPILQAAIFSWIALAIDALELGLLSQAEADACFSNTKQGLLCLNARKATKPLLDLVALHTNLNEKFISEFRRLWWQFLETLPDHCQYSARN